MDSSNILLIVSAEVAVVLLLICLFLAVQNRSLRNLVAQLKSKAQELVQEIKKSRANTSKPQQAETVESTLSYLDYIETQIQHTLQHHESLNSNQDIALDIEPGTPLPHRTASLRHALLLAEKECFSQIDSKSEPNWRNLRSRYDQIFSFLEDFPSETEEAPSNEELQTVQTELENARKRVKNLEKFKNLYFDIEEKFKESQKNAQNKYEDLSSMASELDSSGKLNNALSDYHSSYNSISNTLDQGIEGLSQNDSLTPHGSQNSGEIEHLRNVAADQHRIISELERQLRDASSEEERTQIVEGLQTELQKQLRFVQESETCIQLLEDELNIALRDAEQVKSRLNQLPQLKSELHSLRKQHDQVDLKNHTLISENRKLQKRIKEFGSAPKTSVDGGDAAKLRKELNDMEGRYNELEEKFLDLKLQQ